MAKYRKKPVVIDAEQLTEANLSTVAKFMGAQFRLSTDGAAAPQVIIPTLEGNMTASVGDWIIRGVQGEFYPCKPDIFAATYEAVE